MKDLATRITLLKGTLHEGLYKFSLGKLAKSSPHSAACLNNQSSPAVFSLNQVNQPHKFPEVAPSTLNQWHYRLGHPMLTTVKHILSKCNISFSKNDNLSFCSSCELGKSHRLPFSSSLTCYNKPLQLIYSDIWGPAHTTSTNGFKYYISFVDAYSRYTWIFFLKEKSEVFHIFLQFKTHVELQYDTQIKILQTDWGGEYRPLTPFFQKFGIQHRLSCPHTSQQNGVVERKHRQIADVGLSLLAHAHMPLKFCDDAFSTAVFLINRLPNSAIQGVVPLKRLSNLDPHYSFLRVFGCLCFPYLRVYNTHKLDFRSKPCTFLGYSNKHKGYKCISQDGRVYISRHVKFDECSFPFSNTHSNSSHHISAESSTSFLPIPSLSQPLPCFPSQTPLPPTNTTEISSPSRAPESRPSPSLSISPTNGQYVPPPTNVHSMVTRSEAGIHKPKVYASQLSHIH